MKSLMHLICTDKKYKDQDSKDVSLFHRLCL